MKIIIDKELFQWEKNRKVLIFTNEEDPKISFIQFYNKNSTVAETIPLIDNFVYIPNYLLKENFPIMVLACTGEKENTKVVARREFRVIKRTKPQDYIDEGGIDIEIIYDGGEER